MADFVPKTIVKSATRVLTNPIDSVSSFDTIVDGVVTDNPFTCTTYTVSGETMDAVAITKRSYGARLVWEDAEAKNVGNTTERYDTSAGFNAGVAIIMASAPLATQHGGMCSHDPDLIRTPQRSGVTMQMVSCIP